MNYELFNKIVIWIAIIALSVTPMVYFVYFVGIGAIWTRVNDANIVIAIASVGIAFASAIIGVCALWVSMRADKRNERQARLSVKPYLTVLRRSGGDYYKIVLANYGVGPAIIKNFKLSSKDIPISLNDSLTYKKFLRAKMKEFKNKKTAHRGPNSAIKTGEEITLWGFKYDRGQKSQNLKDIQELVLRIEYQSIYKDEVFTYDTVESRKFIE